MVCFQFGVHQCLDLEHVEVAANHHPQVIREEFDHMMVRHDLRVFTEYLRLFWLFNVAFDRHQALFTHFGQNLEQHRQHVDIDFFVVGGTLEQAREGLKGGLDVLLTIAGDKCASRTTEDHQQFQRLKQRSQVPAGHGKTAKNRAERNQIANGNEHALLPREGRP